MKTVLGLEWSTRRVSVAVQAGGIREQRVEPVDRFQLPPALAMVDHLLQAVDLSPGDLTEIRVGRGPGNTTGIRQALAFATGLAAPGGVRVRTCASPVAVPSRLLAPEAWVLGDARRGVWWGGEAASDPFTWELAPPEAWRDRLGKRPVVSAEPDRLDGLQVQEGYPEAAVLLDLPDSRLVDPVEPIYPHRAVG